MSAKSISSTVRQFLDKVSSSGILDKQNELEKVISGPLRLAREKNEILKSDEAISVLARIDPDYNDALRRNVEGIFYEEQEGARDILSDLDICITELYPLLELILQRLQNSDSQSCSQLGLNCYEDARFVLTYLKLKTNILRLRSSVSIDEPVTSCNQNDIITGDFLLRLSKLSVSCELLEAS